MSRNTQALPSSPFATNLRALLDDTDFYKRKDWADFLSVTRSALTQWVRDQTIPRADLLRMVIDLLRLRGGRAAEGPLAEFDRLRMQPAEAISPHGIRFGATLDDYLRTSVLDFARSLREMSADDQVALIKTGAGAPSAPAAGARSVGAPTTPREDERHQKAEHGWSRASYWEADDILSSSRVSPRFVREQSDGVRRSAAIEDVLSLRHVVVHGSPGSGKSTALRLLQRAFEERGQHPELLNLRYFHTGRLGSVFEAATRNAAKVVLFDGLDELDGTVRSDAAHSIARLAHDCPALNIVVSSRPVPELQAFSGFTQLSVAPLTDVDLVHSAALQIDDHEAGDFDKFFCHLSERRELRKPMRNPIFFKSALALFRRSAVTPFWEADVVREYIRALFDQDSSKRFTRVREPWASTYQLPSLLGEISYSSLRDGVGSFGRSELRRWLSDRDDDFLEKLEDFLEVQGFIVRSEDTYSFTYGVVRDYLAAQYAVDRVEDTARFLGGWRQRPVMRSPLRIACSLATDASPIMQSIMDDTDQGAEINLLLADMLAQPLSVDDELLDASCDRIVSWLDHETSSWTRAAQPQQDVDPAVWWLVVLQLNAKVSAHGAVAEALTSIHRARSGPAYEPLKRHLARSRSSFLPMFATAMEVDGRLSCRFDDPSSPGALTVAIEGPQFA